MKYWYTWKILKALGTTLYYIKYIFTLVGTCPEISVVIDTEWIGCGRHQVHDVSFRKNHNNFYNSAINLAVSNPIKRIIRSNNR